MCTLLYLKGTADKDILDGTENPAARGGAAWMGAESGADWICVHVWLSPFLVHLKPSQHYLATLQYKIKSYKENIGLFFPLKHMRSHQEVYIWE